jgi:two-component system sensor histidine kinase PrrB
MRSLRGRLTLGVATVLAAVLLVSGISVSRYVERAERETVDERLKRTADLSRANALDAVQQELPLSDRRLDDLLRASGTSLRLTLGGTPIAPVGSPPPSPPARRDGLRTLEVDGKRYRVYTTSLDSSLGDLARLEVTTRLERIERRQRELDRNLMLLGGLALLIAATGTFLFANLLLRPLRRLRRLTATIASDEDLDRRIPADEGPGELRALAASFDAMLTRLARSSADRERALEATRRFAADAGHELRTPLTSVQANLSSLRRHPDIPAERRAELLDDALGEQRRLVALLDGLQALARGDAAPLEHTQVDLAELLDHALEAARSRHPATRWDVELPEEPVEVEGWGPGLRLVLDNLVENAAHHGRAGGTVHVGLSANGSGANLVVEDDGPGIPAAERERIFEPFARLDGTLAPGSGLGLALVAQQARHHGAQIELDDSDALGGARFRVRFVPAPPQD